MLSIACEAHRPQRRLGCHLNDYVISMSLLTTCTYEVNLSLPGSTGPQANGAPRTYRGYEMLFLSKEKAMRTEEVTSLGQHPTIAPQSQGDSRGTLTELKTEATYWSCHTSLIKRLQAVHLCPPHTLSPHWKPDSMQNTGLSRDEAL